MSIELNKNYTDLSGYFYEGQTKNDVKDFDGLKSIFYNAHNEFNRIDSNKDGVLSKDEITVELQTDLKKQKRTKILSAITAFCAIGSGILTKNSARISTTWGVIGGLNIASFLYSHYKQKEVEEKLVV